MNNALVLSLLISAVNPVYIPNDPRMKLAVLKQRATHAPPQKKIYKGYKPYKGYLRRHRTNNKNTAPFQRKKV